jgi:CHAT domain-containing protein/Tfp pilus assembly protein PilF
MRHIFLFALLAISFQVKSQSIIDSIDELLLNSEYTQVIKVVDQHAPNDEATRVLLQNRKAEALIRLGQLENARDILASLEKNLPSDFHKAITLTNLGFLSVNLGEYDDALTQFESALHLFDKENKSNSLEAAQTLTYLGLLHKYTLKDTQAEQQMLMALSIRQKLLPENHELIAASYNDLGLIYARVNNDKALTNYEKALVIYEKLHGNDHPKIAIANSNIGFIYLNDKLYGDAVNNFESALKIWEKVYTQPHASKAFVIFNLGETYSKMGDDLAAEGYFKRSLEMYQQTYGKKYPEIATVLNAMGAIEVSKHRYDQGLKYYQQALQANVSDFNSDDENQNPTSNEFYNGNILLYSLLLKAQALEQRYFSKTLRFADLRLSLETLRQCDLLIDKLRQQSSNEADKIALGSIATEVYADGVRISKQTAMVALKKRPYLERAFYFAEKSKSAVLLDAISESHAKSFAGIPTHLLKEEKELKTSIALTAQKLAQKPSTEEEKVLRESAFKLDRSYQTFVKKLESEFPSYYNLKFNAASPSIDQLQNVLDPKTALISYFIDDANKRLYIFFITKKYFEIQDHTIPDNFDKQITALRNGLHFNVIRPYAIAANTLSKILIPNGIPSRINQLVIIPTGRLSIIPFEALTTKFIKTGSEFNNLPYLLNDYSIRYEFSAGLLLQKKKQTASTNQSIFLCAPVNFPAKDNLTELPGTESEVKAISQLFASKNISNDVVMFNEANEIRVKDGKLKNYSILHFATHGVVDESDPQLSRIFLQNNSATEDGNLFAGEIYNLEMDANLVTLSACQTGLGKIAKGEGVIGLSRALVYAGAKNIVVSFWSVADESTSELMKVFYQRLLENPSAGYSDHLRQAKLTLLKSEKYSSPYFWAPFVLIGF